MRLGIGLGRHCSPTATVCYGLSVLSGPRAAILVHGHRKPQGVLTPWGFCYLQAAMSVACFSRQSPVLATDRLGNRCSIHLSYGATMSYEKLVAVSADSGRRARSIQAAQVIRCLLSDERFEVTDSGGLFLAAPRRNGDGASNRESPAPRCPVFLALVRGDGSRGPDTVPAARRACNPRHVSTFKFSDTTR